MVLLTFVNRVNIAVYESVGDFGTMNALGNRRAEITGLVIKEKKLIGRIRSGAGVIFGVVLAWAISGIGIEMPPPPNSDMGYTAHIRIVPRMFIMAFWVGVLATFLASLYPAYRVARIPVAEALRNNV